MPAVPPSSASASVSGPPATVMPRSSSSVMVPLPVPAPLAVERVAWVGVPSVTVTVSSGSSISSPLTGMAMLALVSPGAMVTVREVGAA